MIIADGWHNSIRKAISPPAQQNEMELHVERQAENNEVENPIETGPIPRPILSISGNIYAITKVNNRDIYVNELKNLFGHMAKQAKPNLKKS